MNVQKKGKFIVIEGIDSCGKGTQLNLLSKRINNLGKKILTADFPRYYSSEWGKMVGQFLTGKFGRFDVIDPHLAVLPYMIDQYTWARDIGFPWLKKGGNIILDRYFTSNVHQVAKSKTVAKKKYREWLWPMGYKELGILMPDLVLFLNVSPLVTKKLIKTKEDRGYLKGRKKDNAEKNWKHQWAAYREYLYMTKNEESWISIKCMAKGRIEQPEVIHERVWKKASGIL
ncbi:MAG: thymidylate kinase [Microgenomates group bacterium GW2011_GWC1_37_8]|uniref:Thymidylate kinase n=2 Tax=Candidatus Woeseibacteriota TaxID=1752722 RepID=A0A0G0P769_9BACT|nr:MAG: thymidylate kinase [Microgenomates group bacterium GW2011_GWC1_37_8]KKQ85121.1 MAG: thymidylate kinase [Candidatus Woesebacteria bacterium GW2011_GWB1_38_8]